LEPDICSGISPARRQAQGNHTASREHWATGSLGHWATCPGTCCSPVARAVGRRQTKRRNRKAAQPAPTGTSHHGVPQPHHVNNHKLHTGQTVDGQWRHEIRVRHFLHYRSSASIKAKYIRTKQKKHVLLGGPGYTNHVLPYLGIGQSLGAAEERDEPNIFPFPPILAPDHHISKLRRRIHLPPQRIQGWGRGSPTNSKRVGGWRG
jgi:hypothetical protein